MQFYRETLAFFQQTKTDTAKFYLWIVVDNYYRSVLLQTALSTATAEETVSTFCECYHAKADIPLSRLLKKSLWFQ